MVIGNGMMAHTFEEYISNDEVLIFASGVSNSMQIDEVEFQRESQLLHDSLLGNPGKLFVYFSTTSIDDKAVNQSPYVRHKLKMENQIMRHSKNYIILRVSNVVGSNGNASTIMNYFVNSIKNDEYISVWKNAERNLIDSQDVKFMVDSLIQRGFKNETIYLAMDEAVKVDVLVSLIEEHLDKKAKVNLREKGHPIHIECPELVEELKIITRNKGSGLVYIKQLLKKYY